MDIQRIRFERSGGFAGIRIATDFELDDLPEAQAEEVRKLLDRADFHKLREKLMDEHGQADGFTYTVTVQYEKHEHTVLTSDTAAPEKLQPLLELLYRIARQRAVQRKKDA